MASGLHRLYCLLASPNSRFGLSRGRVVTLLLRRGKKCVQRTCYPKKNRCDAPKTSVFKGPAIRRRTDVMRLRRGKKCVQRTSYPKKNRCDAPSVFTKEKSSMRKEIKRDQKIGRITAEACMGSCSQVFYVLVRGRAIGVSTSSFSCNQNY
jgi:hypothetical protein